MKKRVFLCFMVLLVAKAQAQEEQTTMFPRLRLGIEAGLNLLFEGEINKPPQIRESQSYYLDEDYDFHCGFILPYQDFSVFYFGIKPEYSLNKRFTVSAGLRFSFYKAVLGSDRNYFLWRISEDDINTNYVKIKNITQKNYYVGVPLEIKFFPSGNDYPVRQYFILGTALNFLAASNSEAAFQNPAMEKYASEVLQQIKKPNIFYGLFYMGAGLKIGRMSNPFGVIEAHFPVTTYGNDKSDAFIKTAGVGFGLRATLFIPILKEHQLTY
ncbi:MAG: hypothetical protein FWH36_02165 [Lentimicrobiaceae bacterium]|nr:hypothetical protein [Lentimicrobiaceae bacterium]